MKKLFSIFIIGLIYLQSVAQQDQSNAQPFPLAIHQKVSTSGQNTLLSPYSITSALGMTYVGANGATKEQMSQILGFSTQKDEFLKETKSTIKAISSRNGLNMEISTANTLWVQKSMVFKSQYKQEVLENFNASLKNVDFAKNSEAARLEINKWVMKQTKDKIKDLIAKGMIDAGTRMVLVNAVYFNGKWKNAFQTSNTKHLIFNIDNNTKKETPFMHRQGFYQYFENQEYQMVELPYANEDISMFVMLPRKITGLEEMEKKMNIEQLNTNMRMMRTAEVSLSIPKFKFTYSNELSKTLQAMGLNDAFSDGADFSGITGKKDLKIDKVIHKTFIDVSESGTEAAGATAVTMRVTSSAAHEERIIKYFNADHPFMFFIYDKPTKTFLFIGHLYDPSAN